MRTFLWTRRGFLGFAAAGTAVALGCGSDKSEEGTTPGADSSTAETSDLDTGVSDTAIPTDSEMEAGTDAKVEHQCGAEFPRLDLKKDFGAKGDGIADDTDALYNAAVELQKKGGGELVIPPGVYRIGRQSKKGDPDAGTTGAYFKDAPMFTATGLKCLKVSGYGAKLKIADGLHYGGFNPTTGMPADYTSGDSNRAEVGRVFALIRCTNVHIEGLEIDGNNEKLILGGRFGDVDIQAAATGLWFNECADVMVVDVHTHHHGLDGVTVLYRGAAPPRKMLHKLLRVNSEYNGRQAISWIGGWGLECTDCKFNHTGRAMNNGAPMVSRPRAGLDIEPNAGTEEATKEGLFTRCEFVNNTGAGIVTAGSAGAGNATFVDCTIWGTTTYSTYILHPGMKFKNCRIHGTAVHGDDGGGDATLATTFEDCTFEDKPWTDGKVYRNFSLYTLAEGVANVTFRRCTFTNHEVRATSIMGPTNREVFDGCTFILSNTELASGSAQTVIQGARIKSCLFKGSAEVKAGTRTYFLDVDEVIVEAPAAGEPPTRVEGPNLRWNSGTTAGLVGDIAPGTYA